MRHLVVVFLVACSSPKPLTAPAPAPAVPAPTPAPPAGADVATRRAQLAALLDEQWQYTLRVSPESAGKEVGFYADPYNDYGRLEDEMLRAIRLVVDTGLHAKKWTRAQVVQYFHDHSTMAEVDIQAETDRYIAIPGQALGYKIGQLAILRMREKARTALGPAFDVRAFHDEVLGAGALPLDVLEARIDAWIAKTRP